MKKSLLIVFASALTLASCSNDETVKAPDTRMPISFQSHVSKTSRATDATTDNLNWFQVWGFNVDKSTNTVGQIFDGEMVTKNSSSAWTYTTPQYWVENKDYYFTAVSSSSTADASVLSLTYGSTVPAGEFYGAGTIVFNQNQDKANAGNIDVVYAFQKASTGATINTQPSAVDLSFKHALSRIRVSFSNDINSSAYSLRISKVTISNAHASGNLVLGEQNPTWSDLKSDIALNLSDSPFTPSDVAANNSTVSTGTKFIIPSAGMSLKLTFTVTLVQNDVDMASYTHTDVEMPATDFVMGHSYNFKASLTPKNLDPENEMYPITFTVNSVEDWQDFDDQDFNVN